MNEFITRYNETSSSPIESVEKSDEGARHYYAYSHGYYLTIASNPWTLNKLESTGDGKIRLSIFETDENESEGVGGMREVFHDLCRALNPNLTDDKIYAYFDGGENGQATLDGIQLFRQGDADYSIGHERGRIEMAQQ